jgi:hypothetical protein
MGNENTLRTWNLIGFVAHGFGVAFSTSLGLGLPFVEWSVDPLAIPNGSSFAISVRQTKNAVALTRTPLP